GTQFGLHGAGVVFSAVVRHVHPAHVHAEIEHTRRGVERGDRFRAGRVVAHAGAIERSAGGGFEVELPRGVVDVRGDGGGVVRLPRHVHGAPCLRGGGHRRRLGKREQGNRFVKSHQITS